MLTNEALEIEMDVVEKRHVLKKVNRSWNIFLSSFSNHLNDKTRSKNMWPKGVLIEKGNVVMIMWTLVMQECKCSWASITIKDEICKAHTNNSYTIQGWDTK